MAREMKDSGIEWIGEIPSNWGVHSAKYHIDIENGSDPKTEGSIPVYGSGTNSFKTCGEYKEGPAVLVGRKGSIDNPRYIEHRFWNVDTAFNVKAKNGFLLRYYYYLALSFDYKYYISQTTLPSMTQTNYENMSIPVPSFDKQKIIASFLDSRCAEIDKAVEATKASIEEYKKLRQAIITEAVTKGLDPDVEMKDSGIEWIGEIPISWTINTLGRLSSSMRNGYVGPTKEILRESGVRYIQSLHVKDGQILYSDDFYVSEEWGNNHPKIHTNDILIVQTGDIGQVGLVTNDYNECNCHALIICTPKQTIISSAYLCYYFRSSFGLRQLKQFETGATLKHLNSGDIKFSKVILPSLDEQIEICSYLDTKCAEIDSLIKSKEKLIEELTAYRKSLIFEYVTGKKEVPAV